MMYNNEWMMTMENSETDSSWSRQEDKIFEKALVEFPEGVENRWSKIAELLPGKSIDDVRAHYEALLHDVGEIDSGRVELPSYSDESWEESVPGQISFGSTRTRHSEIERKKGTPWTEDEHRLFLIGLDRYGKEILSSEEEVADGVQAEEVRDYEEKEVDSLVVEIVPEEEMIARASKKSKTAQPQISAPIEFFPSRLKEENLPALKREYGRYFPSDFEIIIPSPEERVNTPPPNCRAFYTSYFEHGLRFPLSPILRQLLETFFVSLTQLVPNAIAFIMAFYVLMVARGLQPSFRNFLHFFRLSISTSSNRGYYYVSQRPGFAVLENAISSNSMEWKSNFFFVKALTLRILENGETEEFTYDWGYNQFWV
ncbi:hypothetical protein RD792_005482 [Penstemon davidsonii]|uniref:Uncharacterized protein n=1 Tax=Penstemon davidsonii TaxID=160366 RepID=A0ABR0DKA4_9LAMI|nr:hypothetical protein RD792_005482 [Penstemon davidsonii]